MQLIGPDSNQTVPTFAEKGVRAQVVQQAKSAQQLMLAAY